MKSVLRAIIAAASAAVLILPAMAMPDISAQSSILMCADTHMVLYEHNADQKMLVASTTKILTAIVVIENCDMDDIVEIGAESAGVEGSSMYLNAGECYTVEQLLYGLMLVSGNDAATALALHTAGSIESFAGIMNELAAELGMSNSNFKNPHGLDEEGHYSTARDLALLACYCMENGEFRKIVSTRSYVVGEQTLVNHNRLLWSCDGAIGLKTGYTQAAGRSLVSCAERDGLRLICVTLSDPDDWADHAAIYDWAYASCNYSNVVSADASFELSVISGVSDSVEVLPSEAITVLMPEGSEAEVFVELPRFVFAPVTKGETAGRITVTLEGNVAGSCELLYSYSVGLQQGLELTPWERFERIWTMAGRYCGHSYYLTGDK